MVKILGMTSLLVLAVAVGSVLAEPRPDSFHHGSSKDKTDWDALYAEATSLRESAPGTALLEGCLAAYGGQEKLATLRALRLRYDQVRLGGTSQQVVRTFARGRRHVLAKPGESRYLDGGRCWYENEQQVMELDTGRYCAELFSYLTLAMPLAARTERFDDIRYRMRQDDPLGYLFFDKADSLLVVLGVDPATKLIHSAAGVVRQGEQNYAFVNKFEDHREVDGFILPHRLVSISMGLKVAESTLDKAEINPELAEDSFRPRPRQ